MTMAEEVHCTFFHVFIEFGSTILHTKFVLTPVHLDEAKSNMEEYRRADYLAALVHLIERIH